MNDKRTVWVAWTLCGIIVLGGLFGFVLKLDASGVRDNAFAFANEILTTLYAISFGVVGALILGRHERNTIGWLLMVIALSIAVFGSVQNYLAQTVLAIPEPTLPTLLYFWLSGWTWWLLIGPLLLILLVFPTGRLLSPRWRWVVVMLAILIGAFLLLVTFSPTWTDTDSGRSLPNPIGIIPESIPLSLFLVPWSIILVTTVAFCVASVSVRYRRAAMVEREQLKWFLYACAFFLLVYAGGFLVNQDGPPGLYAILFDMAILAIPISIGIAILRYRLFDIDLIIRRTLIYSTLTALLALVYLGAVIVLQQFFRAFTGAGDDLAIIISTLAIAALFNPLRRRVQDAIDHRFYRRKYDAQQVLARFAATVRDQVELEKLTGELLNVASETMQPASVSLWLNKVERRVKQ